MASSPIANPEVYNELQAKFGYPRSPHLRKLIEAVYSEEEARLCLALPGSAAEVAKQLGLDAAAAAKQLDAMASVGSIQRMAEADGSFTYLPVYMAEVFCDSMMHSMGDDWDEERVFVHGMLDPQGRLRSLRLIGDAPPADKDLLMESLNRWEFRPASRGGKPVALEVLLIVPKRQR